MPDHLPLSPYQESLFYLQRLAPLSPFYTNAIAVRLHGPLDIAALRQAFDDLTYHHPAMRAVFELTGGGPSQRIAPPGSVPLRVHAASGSDLAALTAEMEHVVTEARRPFELSAGPAVRASLAVLGSEDALFSLIVHHIVSDGHSLLLALRDLGAAYAFRTRRGEPPDLPSPADYPEYCQRSGQPGGTARARADRDLSYWHERIRGADMTIELPVDRPRPSVRSRDGDAVVVDLPDDLAGKALRMCGEQGVSAFVLLLASFRVVLAHETGQQDILVPATVSRRTRPALRRMIGYFVNPVLMRTPLNRRLDFTDLLAAESRTVHAALAHAGVPFPQVVRALRPPRAPGVDPLFQVLLDVQTDVPDRTLLDHFARCGLRAGMLDVETATAPVDLALCVRRRGDTVRLTYRYDRELFDHDTVEAIARRHRLFLSAAIEAPQRPVLKHPLLTNDERRLMLNAAEPTGSAGDVRVHELFENSVDAAPEAVALIDGSGVVTYRDLDRLANAGADRLRKSGVAAGELCAIWTSRLDIPTVVALLAVLKAGAAYLAFDPGHPVARLTAEIRRLGLRCGVGPCHPAISMTVIQMPASPEVLRHDDECGRLPLAGQASDMAYAISTSGSTGRPKVVGISHRNAVNFLRWSRSQFTDEELAGVLATTSPVFDCALFELFAPLCGRGAVILAASPLDVHRHARAHPVSLLSTVPSTMDALLRLGRLPDSVRTVNLAGESLPHGMPDRIFAASRARRVFNFYGPSETTTYATGQVHLRSSDAGEPAPSGGSMIGRPIDNVRAYVLDGDRLLPPGVAGELCIGGAGVGIGYLGDAGKTASSFVPDPFAGSPGARMYRTGDRARYTRGGVLQFMGRLDRQVKIRGVRVEPADTEAALREHPAVREAAVVPFGEAAGSAEGLIGYVTPTSGDDVGTDLSAHLAARLPRHLIPWSVVWLDELPRFPNGKLDRRALPDGAVAAAQGEHPPGPTGWVEHALLDVFRTVLRRADIGTSDDFYHLGGDSILMVAVLATVSDELGVDVPLESFMQDPTIKGLAALIEPEWEPRPRGSLVRVAPTGSGPPLFVVHGGSGDVGFLHVLVQDVDFGRPVYGLRARGLDASGTPLTTIHDMAEAYLAEVREACPDGPYLLAGNCMGGLVAYELAQRLDKEGATVAFLGLINTWPPADGSCSPVATASDGVFGSLVETRLAALRHEYDAIGAGHIIDSDLAAERTLGRPSFFRRWVQVALHNEQAAKSWLPTSYPHDIHVFTDEEAATDRNGWASLVLGSTHIHQFSPQPIQLATRPDLGKRMRECIEAVWDSGPPPRCR